jgi:hypothetical protein
MWDMDGSCSAIWVGRGIGEEGGGRREEDSSENKVSHSRGALHDDPREEIVSMRGAMAERGLARAAIAGEEGGAEKAGCGSGEPIRTIALLRNPPEYQIFHLSLAGRVRYLYVPCYPCPPRIWAVHVPYGEAGNVIGSAREARIRTCPDDMGIYSAPPGEADNTRTIMAK